MSRVTCCALLLAGFVAACGSSPPIRYYTLAPTAATPSAVGAGPSVVVGPVSVPERIDRPSMVRVEGSRLDISDDHRWAAPLKVELASRVAATLSREQGWGRVLAGPQSSLSAPDLSLSIDVQRLEAKGIENVTLEAVWSLRRGGQEVASGRFAQTEPLADGSFGALAATHGHLADALARSIAARRPPP